MIIAEVFIGTDFSAERYETVFDYIAFSRVFHVADYFQLHVTYGIPGFGPPHIVAFYPVAEVAGM